MRRVFVLVAVLTTTGILGWAAPTQAAVITYAVASIASGTLGGTPFTDALLTVTLTADTSGVTELDPVSLPGVLTNAGTATVSIGGVGSATFNDPGGHSAVFFPSIFGLPGVAIFRGFTGTSGTAVSGLLDPSLAGYDLVSAFGPVTGSGVGVSTNPGGTPVAFSTTAGALTLTDGNDPATLTVTVAAVPEPASLSLVAVGALSVIAARRRRQRHDS